MRGVGFRASDTKMGKGYLNNAAPATRKVVSGLVSSSGELRGSWRIDVGHGFDGRRE